LKILLPHGVALQVTGYTVKWLEVQDSYKATIAMANNEVELVVANSGSIDQNCSPLFVLIIFPSFSGLCEGLLP